MVSDKQVLRKRLASERLLGTTPLHNGGRTLQATWMNWMQSRRPKAVDAKHDIVANLPLGRRHEGD